MPQSHPNAADLLTSVRETLERELLPVLKDDKLFHLRVSLNLLATVERELRQGGAIDAAARERLIALLGHDGSAAELERELGLALRAGKMDTRNPELIAHLKASVTDALGVNNPKWLKA